MDLDVGPASAADEELEEDEHHAPELVLGEDILHGPVEVLEVGELKQINGMSSLNLFLAVLELGVVLDVLLLLIAESGWVEEVEAEDAEDEESQEEDLEEAQDRRDAGQLLLDQLGEEGEGGRPQEEEVEYLQRPKRPDDPEETLDLASFSIHSTYLEQPLDRLGLHLLLDDLDADGRRDEDDLEAKMS